MLGDIGSIFILLGIFTEDLLRGTLSLMSLTSLLNDPPLDVLLADPMLTSIGEISSWIDGRFDAPIIGSIFLGYYSLNDFFFVCLIN